MKTLILFSTMLLVASGCRTTGNDASLKAGPETQSQVTPGQFKLYDEPNANPSASCDVHTFLNIVDGPDGPRAHMEMRVGGTCEIAVTPNKRVFDLEGVTTDGCGAKIYKGSRPITGMGLSQIEIVDHRSNICEAILPAIVVVSEMVQGLSTEFYGKVLQGGGEPVNPSGGTTNVKLYDEPNAEVNDFCDRYTMLQLTEGSSPKARLENRLGGTCEIVVVPNQRDYKLQQSTGGCGQKIYKGSRAVTGGGQAKIEITDHRTNICDLVLPALFVVKETAPQGGSLNLYGEPSH